ncbi:MAG: tRNA lysidine(34) synthetase TilS, partial [Candidatus Dormibacterales bacterium]
MPDGERVLAAVSGGPDSTALLLALVELGRDVVAAHFDHDLREGSREDAAWVAALCEDLGVPLIAGVRSRALPRGSPQAAARELRGEFLDQARSTAGARRVALAHTAGDVVEGVLLHLPRGSGLAGLRGMPARRGHLVRPMLSIWREEVDAHLGARGIAARSDPSNSDPRFARVRVRLQLLPALEASRPGLSARLHAVAERAAGWQAQAEAAAARLCPLGEAATR